MHNNGALNRAHCMHNAAFTGRTVECLVDVKRVEVQLHAGLPAGNCLLVNCYANVPDQFKSPARGHLSTSFPCNRGCRYTGSIYLKADLLDPYFFDAQYPAFTLA